MKLSSLSFLSVILLSVLVSCKKDEPTTEEMLSGKWSSGVVNINIKVGDMTLNQYLVSTGISATEALLYTALVNSTAQSYFTGELQVNADKSFTWKTAASSTAVSGTWLVDSDGKEITLSSTAGLGGVFEITELTDTKMNLHSLQNLDPALMGYAIPSAVSADITLAFTRD